MRFADVPIGKPFVLDRWRDVYYVRMREWQALQIGGDGEPVSFNKDWEVRRVNCYRGSGEFKKQVA